MAKVVRLTCSCGRRIGTLVVRESAFKDGVLDARAGKGEGGKCKKWTCGQNYRANILITIVGSLLIGLVLYSAQKSIERTRIREQLQTERLASFRLEFKDFNQQAGKTILAAYAVAVAQGEYAADFNSLDLKKAFYAAREKQSELPNFGGTCQTLRSYLRTSEAIDALKKLEDSFNVIFKAENRAQADVALDKLNSHWDDFMKTVNAEFKYKD
jgi:hypothetical protein